MTSIHDAIPGLSDVEGYAFEALVETMARHTVAIVPRGDEWLDASGARTAHGRLTKQENKWLRWALIEAVTPAICHAPFLRRFYDRIKTRRGVKDARTATARKLAELTWTVWT